MRTVKALSGGIEINHFMMVDFNAVKTLSAAVGGVKVCLNKPIHDKDYSKLNLSEGSTGSRVSRRSRSSATGTVSATRATWTGSRCSSSSSHP